MLRRCDIQIRDPFVVPVAEEMRYYLYGTTDRDCWNVPGTGFDCYISSDLENWEGPLPVFRTQAGFWADRQFWAPEVHRYGGYTPSEGRYFMFASFKASRVCRGTQVLVSDAPCGPFVPHSSGPVTPRGWECLDGTLFVDQDGNPWMIFCHEWVQVGDGEMCAVGLSRDLETVQGDPLLLFHASEAPWTTPVDEKGHYVTDGPFLHRAKNGTLLMLWSSFGPRGYALGMARSKTGHVSGPWLQDPQALYDEDGGHGMLFRTFAGELTLAIHTPNKTPNERPVFVPVQERDGCLYLEGAVS